MQKPLARNRKFLGEKFMVGETTGRKLDTVSVARQMKIARDVDGQRKFSHEELLSSAQIQSFFSRRAKCKNSEAHSVFDKDYEPAENEEALATLHTAQAPSYVRWLQSLWPRHFTEVE